jgi:hypothetical protein
MVLTVVSAAKAATWLCLPREKRGAFSMHNLILLCYNKTMAGTIFSNLALNMSSDKIKHFYNRCLNIGSVAAWFLTELLSHVTPLF